jgi:hypothetical protein
MYKANKFFQAVQMLGKAPMVFYKHSMLTLIGLRLTNLI